MLPLIPGRGGFLRPFGCGWFIREFLLGHGPEGAAVIDPEKGAPQADIFYHYKTALHRAYAKDTVDWENEERIRERKPYLYPGGICGKGSLVLEPDSLQAVQVPLSQLCRLFLQFVETGMGGTDRENRAVGHSRQLPYSSGPSLLSSHPER